jgi:hypothetical protein
MALSQAADDAGAVFSGSYGRETVSGRSLHWLKWVYLAMAVLVLFPLLLPVMHFDRNRMLEAITKNDVREIDLDLKTYQQEFGKFPTGNDAKITQVLTSTLLREKPLLDLPRHKRDPQGRFLDPWGSAYRIDLSDPANPKVWSPGKNKKDEPDDPHSDDICSWR